MEFWWLIAGSCVSIFPLAIVSSLCFLCSAPVLVLCYKTGCVAWFPAIKSRCKYKTEKSLALRISTLPHLLPAIKLKIETNCQTFSFFLKIVKKRIQLFRKEFLNWSFCIWLYMRLRVILILLKFTLHKTFYLFNL